jgi:hypothetical protein
MHRDQISLSYDPTISIITAAEFSILADKLLLPPELEVRASDCFKNICAQGMAEVPAQCCRLGHVSESTWQAAPA